MLKQTARLIFSPPMCIKHSKRSVVAGILLKKRTEDISSANECRQVVVRLNMSSLKIESLFGVQGRVAVITGGSQGLGETLARAWVVNGGHALITSRTEETLSKLCKELNQCGPGKAEYVVGDLSSKAGCLAVCTEIKKRFQKIHVLVNNAGTVLSAPFDDVPEKGNVDFTLLCSFGSDTFYPLMLTSLKSLLLENN
ncbi:Dehydrogenase reductase SDR member 4 [Puccinia graminis f. sp. tritici]|uniref:Dehydrogenase reductase SDR member 4 n=1 Tax=Puccinia graminis f. sp. tritici TaxID=56615 RepID=A0A5B0S8D4_PUCGR|nr:Dehydrogenase reductase SDR member 4 [Puccinia graminis f. sp. tritici]